MFVRKKSASLLCTRTSCPANSQGSKKGGVTVSCQIFVSKSCPMLWPTYFMVACTSVPVPASPARLVACGPAECRVAGSIPGQLRKQCWGCKHCLYALPSTGGIKQWAPCVKIPLHVKESFGGQNYLQSCFATSLMFIVDICRELPPTN